MTDPTCDKKCVYWEEYGERCPFFIRSGWKDESTGQAKLIEDCAPKRSMLLLMEMSNKMLGLQKSNEQQRNASVDLTKALVGAVEFVNERPGSVRVSVPGGYLEDINKNSLSAK